MRVLIAEDDPALASFVRKGLEAEHYAVDVTSDGEQARAMAGELDYDLLMLDLNLPRWMASRFCGIFVPASPACPFLCSPAETGLKIGSSVWILAPMTTWESRFLSRNSRRGFARSCEEATCRRQRYFRSPT